MLTLLNAVISVVDIATLAALLFVIRLYLQPPGALHYSHIPHWMYDTSSVTPVLVFLVFFILKNFAAYLVYKAQTVFVYRVAARISRGQLVKYLEGPYTDYVQVSRSVHTRQINQQPIEFGHYVLFGLQQIFSEGMLALISVIAILLFNTKIFLLLIVFLVPPVLLAAWYTKRKLRTARARVKTDGELAAQYLNEALDGYIESHIYGKKSFFVNRYTHYQEKLNEHVSQLQIAQWMPSRLVEIFAVLGLFVLILVNKSGGHAVDMISIGAFMAASYKIIPGIVRISNLSGQVRTYAFTIKGLEMKPVSETRDLVKSPIKNISLQDITFSHEESKILDRLTIDINSGDFVNISAASGKGKTTLLNLLLGFLVPENGLISINGIPVNAQERRNYHSQISYVKQQSFLLNDTIRGNITLQEDGHDPQRLQDAIRMAGLGEFIDSFTEGIQKKVTDSGKNISGGQRQRIALARAFYKDADVIILDEPFSEMHAAAEKEILQHLQQLAQSGKIVLLVTHSSHCRDYCTKTVEI